MGYSFPVTLRSPATTLEIKRIEADLGFQLNSELKELYSLANGSEYSNSHFGIIPIHRLLSLNEAKTCYKHHVANSVAFNTTFQDWETGESPGQNIFPFLSDDSQHTYWVDLNTSINNGKIYDALSIGESPFYAYCSLTLMFKAIQECYEKGALYLDEDGWLECSFSDFAEICKKNNSGKSIGILKQTYR